MTKPQPPNQMANGMPKPIAMKIAETTGKPEGREIIASHESTVYTAAATATATICGRLGAPVNRNVSSMRVDALPAISGGASSRFWFLLISDCAMNESFLWLQTFFTKNEFA